MSGALAELVRGPLKNDNQEAAKLIDVYLVEAGPRLLPMFDETLTTRTKKYLEKIGVNVLLNTAVSSVESGSGSPAGSTVLEGVDFFVSVGLGRSNCPASARVFKDLGRQDMQ